MMGIASLLVVKLLRGGRSDFAVASSVLRKDARMKLRGLDAVFI